MDKKSILHELYVFSEWKPEPEYTQKPDGLLPENISGLWRWLKFFGAKKSLIDSVATFKDSQEKWQIALGDQGKVIAVLTDNIIEIRTKRSDYATIAARTTVSRDGHSQWRKLVWSPDCSFLALAYGNGVVSFFDLAASNLFNIPIECSRPGGMECTDTTHAVAEIIFMPLRVKDIKWNWEVLIITYDGKLRGFLISQTDGFKLHHSFNFNGGVGAVAYSAANSLLYVAGVPRPGIKNPESSLYAGITAWRILNDEPFYKLSVVSDNLEADITNHRLRMYFPLLSKNLSFIVSAIISPEGTKLACIHCTGDISIWQLPSLRLQARYPLLSQPQHDLETPLVNNVKKHALIHFPAYVSWWDEQEIIISRFSGAVSVCDVDDMVNILGKNPEFMQGVPQVTSSHDGSFMALECETQVLPAKKSRSDESMEVVKVEEAEDDTLISATKEMIKTALYALTDLEAFQPKPKKITVVSRIYRLLGIKSTTPIDLLSRKISAGKYNDALHLAEEYRLDKDLVYQQQWRKTHVSTEAIKKYLSKVSQKTWAVHQCVDRLPETSAAAAELVDFGLELTNKEILREINAGRVSDERISDPEDISLSDLSAYSSEMLRCRYVMLFYKERLKLYEAIIKTEKSTYVKEEYDRLRSNKLSHSAIQLAREGRIAALTCLWSYFKNVNTQLEILDQIPETINPLDYKHLLPTKVDEAQLRPLVPELEFHEHDWCRKNIFRSIWSSEWSADVSVHEQQPVNNAAIAQWYEKRTREIEMYSGLVSHAMTLAKLGEERDIVNRQLMFNLGTLDTLVYDIYCTDVSLQDLDEMSVLDVCKLLMTGTTLETFVSDIQKYMVPYLRRCEQFSPGSVHVQESIVTYLEHISVEDLSYVLTACKAGDDFKMTSSVHMRLVEQCLMAYNRYDCLDMAKELISTVPIDTDDTLVQEDLDARIASLLSIHEACCVLNNHGADVTMHEVKEMRFDKQQVYLLLTKIARHLASGGAKTDTPAALMTKWRSLLQNMLSLQDTIFSCISKETIFEIHASALLTSGNIAVIRMSEEVLDLKKRDLLVLPSVSTPPINRERTQCLLLTAAQEYVNSAASLTDTALVFAKCCLTMIEDPPRSLTDELNLIEAFPIIKSFGVSILPIQVRLCEDRLSLIDRCLKSDPRAYLSTQKLLHLGTLLKPGVCEEREGHILHLVCRQSLSHGMQGADVSTATALRLAQLGYGPAAPVLHEVAKRCAAVLEPATRKHLLSAAAGHLVGNIRGLLKDRLNLEAELLHKEVTQKMAFVKDDDDEEEDEDDHESTSDDEFCDAVTTPTMERETAPRERDYKKSLINQLLNPKCIPYSFNLSDSKEDEETKRMLHYQEFYRGLYGKTAMATDQYDYTTFSSPNTRSLANSLLYSCYFQTSKHNPSTFIEAQVLFKAANELMYKDTPLAVSSYIRACNKELLYKKVLENQNNQMSLAILLYPVFIKCCQPSLKDIAYLTSPVELARSILKNNIGADTLVKLVKFCLNKLEVISVCDRVDLDYAVNSTKFVHEAAYRCQVLSMIAKTKDKSHFELALSLADKYSIDKAILWSHYLHVYIKNAEDVEAVDELLEDNRMIESFKQNKDNTKALLTEHVYNQIKGADLVGLLIFYIVLKSIDEDFAYDDVLSAAEHVKLLKKIRAVSPDIDYKMIIERNTTEEFIDHLVKVVRPEKIGMLMKILRQLPSTIKLPAVDKFYALWLHKYFFNSPSSGNLSNKKWMQQFRQCVSFFDKMSSDDILQFITFVCFTNEAIQRVPSGTRLLMIAQAVDYCQQEYENDLKLFKSDSKWSTASQEMTRWSRFLENYHSPTIQAVIATSERKPIWVHIEMSQGLVEKIKRPLCMLIMETTIKPPSLATVLRCLNVDVDFVQLFFTIVQEFSHSSDQLETLISRLKLFYKDNYSAIPEELVTLISDTGYANGLSPQTQIELLSLCQKKTSEDGEGLSKVITYSLDLFKSEWKNTECADGLTAKSLETAEGRYKVFMELLPSADSWPRRKALVDVLTCWPLALNTSSDTKSMQCEFLHALLTSECDPSESVALIKLLMRKPALTEEEVEWLEKSVTEAYVINFLWILLLSKNDALRDDIPRYLLCHKNKIRTNQISDDLVKEILDNGIFVQCVATPIYSAIVNYILNHSDNKDQVYNVDWAVNELLKASYVAEAGHIKLLNIGVPEPLRGFNETVRYFIRDIDN